MVEQGLITAEQLAKAQAEAARNGQTVRQTLVRLKLLDPEVLAQLLSRELGIPRVELKSYLVDTSVLEVMPEALARKHRVLPLFKLGQTLTVATADPLNLVALDEIRLRTNLMVEPVVATEAEIAHALEEYYGARGRLDEMISDLTQEKLGLRPGIAPEAKQLQGLVTEPPIVRLVNFFLADAIRTRASDIHLESEENGLRVRFRVDGLLREFTTVPKHLEAPVVSRIKILSNLDIAERRKPQDGRCRISMEGHEVDIRVSVMPSVNGETVVLRLLDTTGLQIGLDQMGMSPELLTRYQALLHRGWGILLSTGPTGSGKTTTLYASLSTLNAVERNIITIEDPVEYHLPGARQIQVNPAVDLTFANGLRAILRQDPNIIMVGEIRDRETAEIAVQAALTGHLVFSTLHTNDAPTAITRLLDMGIEPFLIVSSLIGVLAQRLVRTICPECKVPDPAQTEMATQQGFLVEDKKPIVCMRGKGCRTCSQTGYRGRLGIFELMGMDEGLSRLAIAKASSIEIKTYAVAHGMRTLRQDGIAKIAAGITTVEEVLRVTQQE